MSKSLPALAAVVVLLAAAAPARADKPRVAVAGVAGESATPELRQRMSQAVAAGLAASGADVRTEPGPVAYRVRGTVDVEGRNYTLRLEIVDVKTGEIVDSREDRCEICTESEALETAGLAASALKAQVFKKRPTTSLGDVALVAPPAAPAAAPPGGDPTSLRATPGGPGESEPGAGASHAPHRKLGVAGIAAGVVAAAAGGLLLGMNHDVTCDAAVDGNGMPCPTRYDTAAGGVALLAGGGLAIAAGVLAVAGVF